MSKRIEYFNGQNIGQCIFIKEVPTESRMRHAIFRCKCGNEFTSRINHVRYEKTKSCGCERKQIAQNKLRTHGLAKKMPEYFIWKNMKERCFNKNNPAFKHYGERGIFVCERWKNSFVSFIEDMGIRPTPKHSIDRIDNNKGYTPDNCRWTTREQQARNTSRTINLEYKGEVHCMSEWAIKYSINPETLRKRLMRGLSIEQAIEK